MNTDAAAPILAVVGRSGVGKTTLLEKLIRELKSRGVRVAMIKHDVHGFEMDSEGKDTWRFTQAGADAVAISCPHKMAIISTTQREYSLNEIEKHLRGMADIIITEGYRGSDRPKIEVTRREFSDRTLCAESELIGVVADYPLDYKIPQFGFDDITLLADFIIERFLVPRGFQAITLIKP